MKNKYLQDTKKKIEKWDMMKEQLELRKRDIEFQIVSMDINEDELVQECIKRNIKLLENEVMKLEKDIAAIEKGLKRLSPIAYKIIDLKYRKKEKWVYVSMEVGYGQSRCKEIGKEALMIIGGYLHGIKINQDLPLVIGAGCY